MNWIFEEVHLDGWDRYIKVTRRVYAVDADEWAGILVNSRRKLKTTRIKFSHIKTN